MKRNLLSIALILFFTGSLAAQDNYQLRTIAFYNLENLFDTIDDPEKNDEASPIMQIQTDRESVYAEKLNNMASSISINRLNAIFNLLWEQEQLFLRTPLKKIFLEPES